MGGETTRSIPKALHSNDAWKLQNLKLSPYSSPLPLSFKFSAASSAAATAVGHCVPRVGGQKTSTAPALHSEAPLR